MICVAIRTPRLSDPFRARIPLSKRSSVKPPRHGSPNSHHQKMMMGNPMPKRRTRTGKEAQPQICGARINYAKLKVDGGSQTSEKAAEPNEALGGHRNSKANDTENQGHGLTGALAPQSAATRRWAVIIMGENGFEDAPDLGDALSIAIDETGKPKCRIDYSRYESSSMIWMSAMRRNTR